MPTPQQDQGHKDPVGFNQERTFRQGSTSIIWTLSPHPVASVVVFDPGLSGKQGLLQFHPRDTDFMLTKYLLGCAVGQWWE